MSTIQQLADSFKPVHCLDEGNSTPKSSVQRPLSKLIQRVAPSGCKAKIAVRGLQLPTSIMYSKAPLIGSASRLSTTATYRPRALPMTLDIPTADFRAGTRYIIFLKRMGSGLEVAVRPYQIEIAIAPSAPAGARPNADTDVGLANELIYAIQSGITRFPSRYFDWTEELIGKETVGRVQPFLNSSDPEVRYGAAWWLSFRKLDAAVMNELRQAAQNDDVQEGERSGAKDRLRDIAEGRYVPSNP